MSERLAAACIAEHVCARGKEQPHAKILGRERPRGFPRRRRRYDGFYDFWLSCQVRVVPTEDKADTVLCDVCAGCDR